LPILIGFPLLPHTFTGFCPHTVCHGFTFHTPYSLRIWLPLPPLQLRLPFWFAFGLPGWFFFPPRTFTPHYPHAHTLVCICYPRLPHVTLPHFAQFGLVCCTTHPHYPLGLPVAFYAFVTFGSRLVVTLRVWLVDGLVGCVRVWVTPRWLVYLPQHPHPAHCRLRTIQWQ